MKLKILFLTFFILTALVAQDSKTTPPVIVAKITLGETVLFENTTITFKRVIEDSRCPKDVDCIWAGQAKVLIVIETKDTNSEKELIFHGTNFGTEHENTLFVSETKTYIGYRLSPYPVSTASPDKRNYFLEVYLK
jgi:hypothetical protein